MKQIILLTTLFLTFGLSVFAQPKTVTDYFLAMPDTEDFPYYRSAETTTKAALIKFRKSLIEVEDIKNGYLKLKGTWNGYAEIALFKKTDGSYLIANLRADCEEGCEGFLSLYSYKNAKWTDVGFDILPRYGDIASEFNKKRPKGAKVVNVAGDDTEGFSFTYDLPKVGKSIKVSCSMCIPTQKDPLDKFYFAEYEWNGAKFVKK